jgi:hypothetical protein
MALELSEQAYDLCVGEDASALQALLDAHPGIDLYLFEPEMSHNIMSVAAAHESTEYLQLLLDFKADVNKQMVQLPSMQLLGMWPCGMRASASGEECRRATSK